MSDKLVLGRTYRRADGNNFSHGCRYGVYCGGTSEGWPLLVWEGKQLYANPEHVKLVEASEWNDKDPGKPLELTNEQAAKRIVDMCIPSGGSRNGCGKCADEIDLRLLRYDIGVLLTHLAKDEKTRRGL